MSMLTPKAFSIRKAISGERAAWRFTRSDRVARRTPKISAAPATDRPSSASLGVTYQTAWFMEHRIREAMRDGTLSPLGGEGSVVEIDESFVGPTDGFEVRQGAWHRNAILTLVERSGSARSFHVDTVTKAEVLPIVREN